MQKWQISQHESLVQLLPISHFFLLYYSYPLFLSTLIQLFFSPFLFSPVSPVLLLCAVEAPSVFDAAASM